MKNLINVCVICCGLFFVSCAGVQLTKEQKTQVGVASGCAIMGLETFKCFGDNFVQGVFPGIDAGNCYEKIMDVINGGEVKVDPASLLKAKDEGSACLDALQNIKDLNIFK
jgi:hypothetical protein